MSSVQKQLIRKSISVAIEARGKKKMYNKNKKTIVFQFKI